MLKTGNCHILSFILLFACMSVLSGNAFASAAGSENAIRLKTVVIDPGHGGNTPGCIDKTGKIKEKDITLSVATKFGNMIKKKYPGIKVIYTRTTDKSVDLRERTNIANRNNADLFISIHVNAARDRRARGTETWVMGTEKSSANLEVCKLENSVIKLEDDYSMKYEGFDPDNPESYIIFSLLQNTHLEQSLVFAEEVQKNLGKGPIVVNRGVKQAQFLVLWTATMPAVLVELGFLSNDTDCRLLANKYNHETFAKRLFDSFEAYKEKYESTGNAATPVKDAPEKQQSEVSGTVFAIQIFSRSEPAGKSDRHLFKGLDTYYIKEGNYYKYMYGRFTSASEAKTQLNEVRKLFRDAFIVKICDGKIVR